MNTIRSTQSHLLRMILVMAILAESPATSTTPVPFSQETNQTLTELSRQTKSEKSKNQDISGLHLTTTTRTLWLSSTQNPMTTVDTIKPIAELQDKQEQSKIDDIFSRSQLTTSWTSWLPSTQRMTTLETTKSTAQTNITTTILFGESLAPERGIPTTKVELSTRRAVTESEDSLDNKLRSTSPTLDEKIQKPEISLQTSTKTTMETSWNQLQTEISDKQSSSVSSFRENSVELPTVSSETTTEVRRNQTEVDIPEYLVSTTSVLFFEPSEEGKTSTAQALSTRTTFTSIAAPSETVSKNTVILLTTQNEVTSLPKSENSHVPITLETNTANKAESITHPVPYLTRSSKLVSPVEVGTSTWTPHSQSTILLTPESTKRVTVEWNTSETSNSPSLITTAEFESSSVSPIVTPEVTVLIPDTSQNTFSNTSKTDEELVSKKSEVAFESTNSTMESKSRSKYEFSQDSTEVLESTVSTTILMSPQFTPRDEKSESDTMRLATTTSRALFTNTMIQKSLWTNPSVSSIEIITPTTSDTTVLMVTNPEKTEARTLMAEASSNTMIMTTPFTVENTPPALLVTKNYIGDNTALENQENSKTIKMTTPTTTDKTFSMGTNSLTTEASTTRNETSLIELKTPETPTDNPFSLDTTAPKNLLIEMSSNSIGMTISINASDNSSSLDTTSLRMEDITTPINQWTETSINLLKKTGETLLTQPSAKSIVVTTPKTTSAEPFSVDTSLRTEDITTLKDQWTEKINHSLKTTSETQSESSYNTIELTTSAKPSSQDPTFLISKDIETPKNQEMESKLHSIGKTSPITASEKPSTLNSTTVASEAFTNQWEKKSLDLMKTTASTNSDREMTSPKTPRSEYRDPSDPTRRTDHISSDGIARKIQLSTQIYSGTEPELLNQINETIMTTITSKTENSTTSRNPGALEPQFQSTMVLEPTQHSERKYSTLKTQAQENSVSTTSSTEKADGLTSTSPQSSYKEFRELGTNNSETPTTEISMMNSLITSSTLITSTNLTISRAPEDEKETQERTKSTTQIVPEYKTTSSKWLIESSSSFRQSSPSQSAVDTETSTQASNPVDFLPDRSANTPNQKVDYKIRKLETTTQKTLTSTRKEKIGLTSSAPETHLDPINFSVTMTPSQVYSKSETRNTTTPYLNKTKTITSEEMFTSEIPISITDSSTNKELVDQTDEHTKSYERTKLETTNIETKQTVEVPNETTSKNTIHSTENNFLVSTYYIPTNHVKTKEKLNFRKHNEIKTDRSVEIDRTTPKTQDEEEIFSRFNKYNTLPEQNTSITAKPKTTLQTENATRQTHRRKFKTDQRTSTVSTTKLPTVTSSIRSSTEPTYFYLPADWSTQKTVKVKTTNPMRTTSSTKKTELHLVTQTLETPIRQDIFLIARSTQKTPNTTTRTYQNKTRGFVGLKKDQEFFFGNKVIPDGAREKHNNTKVNKINNEVIPKVQVLNETVSRGNTNLFKEKHKLIHVKNSTFDNTVNRNKYASKITTSNKTEFRSETLGKQKKKIENNHEDQNVSTKEGSKAQVNHIEEILLKYYEEFKNRNSNNKEQKYTKKSPTKRKFRQKIRPMTTDRNKKIGCVQSVMNRKYLNSSHSYLTFIHKERLINYRSLEYLDLSHNMLLRFNVSTLSNLHTLKYISLEYNNLTDLYPINFYTLRNLEFLNLSHNNISRIRNFTFTHMRSLKYLNLHDNALSKINATTFRGLQGLLHLDLSNNKIESLHVECLPKILSLKYLNLSHNKITTLAISNLKSVQTVDLSHNQISSFSNITLGNWTNQMKILKVNNNLLEHLNENIFKNFSKLVYLDMSNNKFNYLSPSTFQYLDNLIFLNVSCQHILPLDQKGTTYTIDENDYYSNSNRRTKSKFRNTSISTSTKQVNNNTYTKDGRVKIESDERYFRKNIDEISNRKSQKFKNEVLTGKKQKELKQTAGNRIAKRTKSQSETKVKPLQHDQYPKQTFGKVKQRKTIQTIPDIIDFKLNLLASISQRLKQFECINVNLNQVPKVLTHSIQILNLKLNKIKIIQLGDLDDYPLLQILLLSQNKIKSIETDSLGRLDYLKILLVDKNKLKYMPISLPENIEILNLNFNFISKIGQEDFFDLGNLEKLYLQSNRIEVIPPNTFLFLRNLKYLDLSNNPIKRITSITLDKLSFINLSNLKNIETNPDDRFPVEDGHSLIGIKLNNSTKLCQLLARDYAFVLTLKQIEYLNCNQTDTTIGAILNGTKENESNMSNTMVSNTNRSRTKLITEKKKLLKGSRPTNTRVNNEPDGFRNSNMVRKRSNKAYTKTINSSVTINNNYVNVNKCAICKVDSVYETSFEFSVANVNSYIEHIVSFESGSNYTQASMYYKHIIEEQKANCLHEGKTKDDGKMLGNTDVNIENYSSMNNSTDVTRGNIVPFMNRRKTTSNNKIFMENSSENNGIFVITKDTDTSPGEYEDSPGLYSAANFIGKHLDTKRFKNMDYAMMNDQAVIPEDNKTESSMFNSSKENEEEGRKLNPFGDENKFSIVRDSKKNVILKLNININNQTEEKLTENYDQLEMKEPTKMNNKEDEGNKGANSGRKFIIKSNKKFMDINSNNSIRSSEHNTRKPESIKNDLINSSYGTMAEDEKLALVNKSQGSFYEAVKSNLEETVERYMKMNKSNQSETEDYYSHKVDLEKTKFGNALRSFENSKDRQINQIRSYLKNYKGMDRTELDKDENQLKDNPDKKKIVNIPESFPPNTIVHKDAQYEMNIVDTDAEFLDIIDDKTENIIDDNTIRTLETSKYHELVSQNTTESMEYHTGMIIFLLIVIFMSGGAFLALPCHWNSLLHSYCHHYVSYRNNGQSDDEANTSDSNFDRIEMLDNVDVYSIT
uniref:Carboxypeptidase N subunit 2 n=1 Tax=Cacopsylla melanoneura TaxID=428564 RepID=A0A8D8VJE1_9HEMI